MMATHPSRYDWRIRLFLVVASVVVTTTSGACSRQDARVRPEGVPRGAVWEITTYTSDPPGARIEVNSKYIGATPCSGPIWAKGRGQAQLNVVAYSPNAEQPSQMKVFFVPPIPADIYFDFRLPQPTRSSAIIPAMRPVPSTLAPHDAGVPIAPAPLRTNVYPSPGGGHWIQSVTDDGEVLILEDGSIWDVLPGDSVVTSIWLPVTEIVVIERQYQGMVFYDLVNTDDDEKIGAIFIGF